MKNKIFRRAGAERQEKEMRGVFRAFLWPGAGWKKEGPLSGEGEECHQAVPGAKKGDRFPVMVAGNEEQYLGV